MLIRLDCLRLFDVVVVCCFACFLVAVPKAAGLPTQPVTTVDLHSHNPPKKINTTADAHILLHIGHDDHGEYDDTCHDHIIHRHHQSNIVVSVLIWGMETPHIVITMLGASSQIGAKELTNILSAGVVVSAMINGALWSVGAFFV